MSEIETCRRGHSRVGLYNTTPNGTRYCKDCHALRMGSRRVRLGITTSAKSKYSDRYKKSIEDAISRLEADIEHLKRKITEYESRIKL